MLIHSQTAVENVYPESVPTSRLQISKNNEEMRRCSKQTKIILLLPAPPPHPKVNLLSKAGWKLADWQKQWMVLEVKSSVISGMVEGTLPETVHKQRCRTHSLP